MTEPSRAIFLSYASQDAPAAQAICAALRTAGVEVWFDQNELRGGDVWDQKIRREIHDCALFMPIVSRHTQERLEGYFRREWKLAVARTHDMAEQKPFLVPVVVDSTGDKDAIVPDLFRAVQWTRLPGGVTPSAFVEHIQRLLSLETAVPLRRGAMGQSGATGTLPPPASARSNRWLFAVVGAVVLSAIAYLALDTLRGSKPATASAKVAASASATTFSPPPHSIAVLPFVNMSGDKDQEYFSEGLTEELLNSLSRINGLQVAARTSSFSFKNKDTDIATIARKLDVAMRKRSRRSTRPRRWMPGSWLPMNTAGLPTTVAQWGDSSRALDWLDTALRVRDSGLTLLKTDPFLDSLRKEPRFQALERQLKFPD